MSQEDKTSDGQHDGSDAEAGADRPDDSEAPPLGSAQAVINAFGGIRPAATKLGLAVSTVQGWKERNAIPEARHGQIRAAAAAHGIDLDQLPETPAAEPEILSPSTAVEPVPLATPQASPAGTAGAARARLRSGEAEEEEKPKETDRQKEKEKEREKDLRPRKCKGN